MVEVRTAGVVKCSQLPCPAVKPRTTKPRMTRTLVAVSTFCTRATRATPKQLSRVKAAIRAQAINCPPPSLSDSGPEPTTHEALDCLSAGKK